MGGQGGTVPIVIGRRVRSAASQPSGGGEEPLFRRRPAPDGGDEPRIVGFLDFALIGSGGFSKVYTAYQERLARTVAVKVVTVELSAELRRRFEREQQTAGQLDGHPNVIRIYESGLTESGQPYLVMEHHAQGSLADRLRRHGPLPVADVLEIGVLLAGALHAAHRRGVVHRDVKPQNVLMSPFAGPVLADFGIAALDPGRFTVTTEAFSVNHAAPEVLAGEPATPAADLYSLASMLYELLSGRPPFSDTERPELLALIRRVQSDPVTPIGRPDLPTEAEAVLTGLLAKDPANRPPSGAAFADELRDIQRGLGLATTKPVGPTPMAQAPTVGDGGDDGDLSMWRPPTAGSGRPSPSAREVGEDQATPPSGPGERAPEEVALPVAGLDDPTIHPPPDPARPAPVTDESVEDGVGGEPPRDATFVRSRVPAGPPDLADDQPQERRSRWGWWAGAAALAVALGVGFGLLRGGDDVAAPERSTTTLPLDRVGPCPPDAEEQADLDTNDTEASYERDDPPTGLRATVDPTDDSRATVTWTDVNDGLALYVVTVRCTGAETQTVPIGKARPAEEPSVTVSGLDAFNYCFSVFAFPTAGADPVLGTTADGNTEACLDV